MSRLGTSAAVRRNLFQKLIVQRWLPRSGHCIRLSIRGRCRSLSSLWQFQDFFRLVLRLVLRLVPQLVLQLVLQLALLHVLPFGLPRGQCGSCPLCVDICQRRVHNRAIVRVSGLLPLCLPLGGRFLGSPPGGQGRRFRQVVLRACTYVCSLIRANITKLRRISYIPLLFCGLDAR